MGRDIRGQSRGWFGSEEVRPGPPRLPRRPSRDDPDRGLRVGYRLYTWEKAPLYGPITGQQFLVALDLHPWFDVVMLALDILDNVIPYIPR
ncbi:MAG: hypothetical protein ACRDJ9_28890 [Dehalococcoidia bacterium]